MGGPRRESCSLGAGCGARIFPFGDVWCANGSVPIRESAVLVRESVSNQ